MKLTKKAASLLLAASLAVSVCATPVFADASLSGNKTTGPSTTQVKYEVTEAYEWTVPAKIDFGVNAGVNAKRVVNTSTGKDTESKPSTGTDGTAPKVIVTKNVITDGKSLKITLAPASPSTDFTVKNDQNVELKYAVTLTKTTVGSVVQDNLTTPIEKTGTQILEVKAGTNTAEAELKFELSTTTDASEKAGSYNGTVQFTADATRDATV